MQNNFVDVWRGRLVRAGDHSFDRLAILSEQERRKAETLTMPLMRERYIAVRAMLRLTLASYSHTDPACLQFNIGPHGKPFLACGSVHFNISHSADDLLIAVSNMACLGIDIEMLKPRSNIDGLAERCFSRAELQEWRQLPTVRQSEAFYRLWTKKEAFVKAVGRGIALGLEACDVELHSGGQLRAIPPEFGRAADWMVTELSLGPMLSAALVTPNCEYGLRLLSLNSAVAA